MDIVQEKKKARKKMVVVRMNNPEFDTLEMRRKQTTERTISSYLRKVALSLPVTVKYRNATADDFLNQMLELKKELNAVGNNFNQAVHKLHILDKIPEFRHWIVTYENLHKELAGNITVIKTRLNQIYEQWLQ